MNPFGALGLAGGPGGSGTVASSATSTHTSGFTGGGGITFQPVSTGAGAATSWLPLAALALAAVVLVKGVR